MQVQLQPLQLGFEDTDSPAGRIPQASPGTWTLEFSSLLI